MPHNDDIWAVIETWVQQRRIPGTTPTRMLRDACTRLLRAYARGKLTDAVRRNRNHPLLQHRTDDDLVQYVESAIEALLTQPIVRARYRLIEIAVHACLGNTSNDEYTDMWLTLEATLLHSPTFQALRDEVQETVNEALRAARQMARAPIPIVTPVKCTRRAKIQSPAAAACSAKSMAAEVTPRKLAF